MSDQLNKDSSSESHRNPADEDSSPEANQLKRRRLVYDCFLSPYIYVHEFEDIKWFVLGIS